jgi:hypothetical protein
VWVSKNKTDFASAEFWKQSGIDEARLHQWYGWGTDVDSSFFNDRTTIILGDSPTAGGVLFDKGRLVPDPKFDTDGDGTVPDSLALVPGVTRVFKVRGVKHMMLPSSLTVIAGVHEVLAGRQPRLTPLTAAAPAMTRSGIRFLDETPSVPVPRPVPVPAPATPATARPAPDTAAPHPGISDAPTNRRLRVFSFDPLLGTDLDALGTEQITLELPWDFADGDRLMPGPVGEYVEVVDYDPASRCFYRPVDLNHPHLLAQDGLPLSEGDPRFHQQMAYGVAMNTIRHFETALGRVALWAPDLERDPKGEVIHRDAADEYVQRLRIYPHAMRQANAYYDPSKKALLLGYFPAQGMNVGRNLPGGMVFTCLSHDVIAHETTHALLDGLHRYFTEPSNPDVFAFHEAIADIVALLQHFTHPEVLHRQLAQCRGNIRGESLLGVLAAQFGEATGKRAALRQYLGRKVQKDGKDVWEAVQPDVTAINKVFEPHERGAILVAAIFRAFADIYENRVADLRRIATGGTGILPDGDLHPDLVGRLADEAAKVAGHILTMCLRALDYVPPVDLTFGEYLRALITADYDLVRDDDRRYRISVINGFRDWGIYPRGVRSLSVDGLLWNKPEQNAFRRITDFIQTHPIDGWKRHTDRHGAFVGMKKLSAAFHKWLTEPGNVVDGEEHSLGLWLRDGAPGSIRRGNNGRPIFEVHSFRPCRRIGPDGQQQTDLVVELVQRRKAFFDSKIQGQVDGAPPADGPKPAFWYRGGCTLIIDPTSGDIRYCVRKSVRTDERLDRERKFRQGQFGDKVGGSYIAGDHDDANPFAFLHAHR